MRGDSETRKKVSKSSELLGATPALLTHALSSTENPWLPLRALPDFCESVILGLAGAGEDVWIREGVLLVLELEADDVMRKVQTVLYI